MVWRVNADTMNMSGNAKFVISHLEEQSGPFSEEELVAKWLRGELFPIDYVFDPEKQDWIVLPERFEWAKTAVSDQPPPLKQKAEPQAEPESAEPMAAPEPCVATTTINLIDGKGEIALNDLKPGQFELALKDTSLEAEPLQIHLKAADPIAVKWSVQTTRTVGEELNLEVTVVDEFDHVCSRFDGRFTLVVETGKRQEHALVIREGVGILSLQNTKAETWNLSLEPNASASHLAFPAPALVEWQAGPATRLILDGPKEYLAGHPLTVQVKAVDNYGNVAKTFQGTVVLEVKAS
jgi:hypothetical protein